MSVLDDGPIILVIIVVALALVFGIGYTVASYANDQTHTCIVEDKYAINKNDSATRFRVETSCGVMEVQDALFLGKFDSADRYASLDIGETYEIGTIGFRIPIISAFPNIVTVQ